MSNITEKYNIFIINVRTAAHVNYPVYDIKEFYNESIKTGGVCILFDVYGDMVEVIASHDDIIYDAYENSLNKQSDCYCLIADSEDDLNPEEIDVLFYGIRNNVIDVHNIKRPYTMEVMASYN